MASRWQNAKPRHSLLSSHVLREPSQVPATARRVISVGAYDARQNTYADFSAAAVVPSPIQNPTLSLPGVDIYAPRSGGGYASFTGTSFSTPFVTGAAALLMDGESPAERSLPLWRKTKSYLRRGAKALQGSEKLPNDLIGWGRLCLESSLPE